METILVAAVSVLKLRGETLLPEERRVHSVSIVFSGGGGGKKKGKNQFFTRALLFFFFLGVERGLGKGVF